MEQYGKYCRGVLFTSSAIILILFSKCSTDFLNPENYATLTYKSTIAIPRAYADYSVKDLIIKLDSSGQFTNSDSNIVILNYADSANPVYVAKYITLNDQDYFFSMDPDIPTIVYLPTGDSISTGKVSMDYEFLSDRNEILVSLILKQATLRITIDDYFSANVRLQIKINLCFNRDSKNAGYIYTDPDSCYITITARKLQYNLSGYDKYLINPFNPWSAFNFKNVGINLGFGIQWVLNDHWKFPGSINDLGSVNWRHDVVNYSVNDKSFVYNGIDLDNINGIESLLDTLKNTFRPEESHERFNMRLYPRSYKSASYKPGQNNSVFFLMKNTYLRNNVVNISGAEYYQKFREILELSTGFYLFDFRYSMIGLGSSVQLSRIGIYIATDNIIGIFNLRNSHVTDLSFGLNFNIF